MTSGNTIDYEALAQDAMRGVVRTVLTEVAKTGLPGDHHFYISFDTQVPGASISKRLKEKYPDEMTIVLQHRFWDLMVGEDRFEVKLTFDGIPERLVIPFRSIRVFFDPSVRYGLQFEEPGLASDPGQDAPTTMPSDPASRALMVSMGQDAGRANGRPRVAADRKPKSPRKPKLEKVPSLAAGEDQLRTPKPAAAQSNVSDAAKDIADTATDLSSTKRTAADAKPGEAKPTVVKPVAAEPSKDGAGAQILSLDQFRKK